MLIGEKALEWGERTAEKHARIARALETLAAAYEEAMLDPDPGQDVKNAMQLIHKGIKEDVQLHKETAEQFRRSLARGKLSIPSSPP